MPTSAVTVTLRACLRPRWRWLLGKTLLRVGAPGAALRQFDRVRLSFVTGDGRRLTNEQPAGDMIRKQLGLPPGVGRA